MEGFLAWAAMGGYAWFVWPSWGLSALVLGGLAYVSWRAMRRAEADVVRLEKDGR